MNRSETVTDLAKALAKAQAQVKPAIKDSANPYFKSKYADLASVWDAFRDALVRNGLSLVQFPISNEGGVGVESILMHESGQFIANEYTVPMAKADAQGAGSCITYCRRYAAAAVMGVCPEDDDANAAVASTNGAKKKIMDSLQMAARKGIASLEKAWKELPADMRVALKNDLASLKETAANATPAA